jgi:hypothetical protein
MFFVAYVQGSWNYIKTWCNYSRLKTFNIRDKLMQFVKKKSKFSAKIIFNIFFQTVQYFDHKALFLCMFYVVVQDLKNHDTWINHYGDCDNHTTTDSVIAMSCLRWLSLQERIVLRKVFISFLFPITFNLT